MKECILGQHSNRSERSGLRERADVEVCVQPALHGHRQELKEWEKVVRLNRKPPIWSLQEVPAANPPELMRESDLCLEGPQMLYNRVGKRDVKGSVAERKCAAISHNPMARTRRIAVEIAPYDFPIPFGEPPRFVRAPNVEHRLCSARLE